MPFDSLPRDARERAHRHAGRLARLALLGVAVVCAACTGGLNVPFPKLPDDAPEFPGSSTTVYTRVARGANTCWFGPRGTLDRTYIWHARAEPEAKGGMAEILIHERFDLNQRGLKAFTVTIAPKGDGAAVSAQNLKMPSETGRQMITDAYRWAKGNVGCREGDKNWAPLAPVTDTAASAKTKKPVPRKAATAPAGARRDASARSQAPDTPLPAKQTKTP